MPERAILLVRSHVPAARMTAFAAAQERFKREFAGITGVHGPTIYSLVGDPETFLTMLELDDQANLDLEHAGKLTEEMALEFHRAMDNVPSVRTIRRVGGRGPLAESLPDDHYLSVSDRIAEPGREDELARDYEMVFESFGVIDGFLGYAFGPDGQTDEHMFGFAAWRDRESLNQTLKHPMRHELRIWRRVHASELETVPNDFAVE